MLKKKKILFVVLAVVVLGLILTGCAAEETADEVVEEAEEDVVSSPSVVTDEESLVNAMSADGSWIIIMEQDLSTDQELVLEGEFTEDGETDRKLALYEQDEDRNVTARYTLEAPRITVQSPNTRFQSGTFVGDVYVEAPNFRLIDFTIDGNLYFENEEAKDTFSMENGSEVTGNLE
jgi:outer membrane murein-binding lipoprotein Lpp